MDFSTNATGVGTNIYSVPSTTATHHLHQQQSSPMFSSFDYHNANVPVPLGVPTNSLGQHPCFMGDIPFQNRTPRIIRNVNDQAKVMSGSYLPNGINNDDGGLKSTVDGGAMMTTPNTQVGSAFGVVMNGSSASEKRDKCPGGAPDTATSSQMTFQELTTMGAEPMNFAVRAQNSQVSCDLH